MRGKPISAVACTDARRACTDRTRKRQRGHGEYESEHGDLTPTEYPIEYVYSNDQVNGEWSFRGRPWMTGHTYKSTGYDANLKAMVFVAHTYTYTFDATRGEWSRLTTANPFRADFYNSTVCATPEGAVTWAQQGDGRGPWLWRLNPKTQAWKPLPLVINPEFPQMSADHLTRTRQLLDTGKIGKVSVAVRTHHPRYDELLELADGSKGAVEVVTEVKELMTRLVRVHFALTSGDMWSPELCVVGIPQFIISQTKRHAANGKKMDDGGVANYLGDAAEVTYEQLNDAVGAMLEDPMERKGMTRCARNTFDGRGPDRIVNGMEIMLHSPARRRTAVAVPATLPFKVAA